LQDGLARYEASSNRAHYDGPELSLGEITARVTTEQSTHALRRGRVMKPIKTRMLPTIAVTSAVRNPVVTRWRHSAAEVHRGNHSTRAAAAPTLAISTVAWIALVVAAAVPLASRSKCRAAIIQKPYPRADVSTVLAMMAALLRIIGSAIASRTLAPTPAGAACVDVVTG